MGLLAPCKGTQLFRRVQLRALLAPQSADHFRYPAAELRQHVPRGPHDLLSVMSPILGPLRTVAMSILLSPPPQPTPSTPSTAPLPRHSPINTVSKGVARSLIPCTYPDAGCLVAHTYSNRPSHRCILGLRNSGTSGAVRASL